MTPFSDEWLLGLQTERPQQEFYDPEWGHRGSFGVRVNRRRGEKVFFLLYSLSGRRRRFPLGRFPTVSLEDARRLAETIVERVYRGEDPLGERKLRKNEGSFKSISDRYLKRRELKPKTAAEYQRLLKTELLPAFGKRQLDTISEREIRRVLFHIGDERGNVVLSNRVRALLHSIFEFGFSAGFCSTNPASKVSPSSKETAKRKPRGTFNLDLESLQQLFRNAEDLGRGACSLVQFVILSGVAVTHVQNLRWADLRGDFWESPDKILVYLSSIKRELLSDLRSTSEYIFTKEDGKPYRNVRSLLSRIKDELPEEVTWTDIQRSIRQAMVKSGIPYSEVALIFSLPFKRDAALEPPDRQLLEWASRRAYTQWAAFLVGSGSDESDPSRKVVRLRRLKRLK